MMEKTLNHETFYLIYRVYCLYFTRVLLYSHIPEVSGVLKSETRVLSSSQDTENNKGKDLRKLIGLELVTNYVKEPKEEPRHSPTIIE